jgi:hypothetical protein
VTKVNTGWVENLDCTELILYWKKTQLEEMRVNLGREWMMKIMENMRKRSRICRLEPDLVTSTQVSLAGFCKNADIPSFGQTTKFLYRLF